MTHLSATFPSNQWPVDGFHEGVDEAAKVLAEYPARLIGSSTDISSNKQLLLKGMTLLLPAGNA